MARTYVRDELGRFTTSGAIAKRTKSSINGVSASSMNGKQKLQAMAIMFGTGSKRYKQSVDKILRGGR